ncbi:MAG TPA: hypothetical protein PLT92_14265 [Ignavibacteriaceae bacterium]|nr:hypothetical protein [Ignavibacteriaceae bacterium]
MSIKDFHVSTAKELIAVKDRVRNLIVHWGEDGRYKEVVLKTIVKRFLPDKYKIGTGFVVREGKERGEHNSSKQIDLLIYDTAFPVLFREGDFIILTPDAVRAIIEVKTNLQNQNLNDILNKANDNGKFVFEGKFDQKKPFFNGIFSYEGVYNSLGTLQNSIVSVIEQFKNEPEYEKFIVNHISFNEDIFYKFWDERDSMNGDNNYIYKIVELSFAFFISNLMDYLERTSVINNSKIWFPADKSFNVESKWRS